jgi:hypothetical protein
MRAFRFNRAILDDELEVSPLLGGGQECLPVRRATIQRLAAAHAF